MDLRTTEKFATFVKKYLIIPINRATLIRISTIDKCLQNHYRRWTINDLIDACTDALLSLKAEAVR